jgi:hypothetical protein
LHGTLRQLLDALFGAELLVLNPQALLELLVLNPQALLELLHPFCLAVTQVNERADDQQGHGWQDAEESNPEV